MTVAGEIYAELLAEREPCPECGAPATPTTHHGRPDWRCPTCDRDGAPKTLEIDGLYRVWGGANFLLASYNYTSNNGPFLLVTDGYCEEPMGNSETYSVGLYCGHEEPGSEAITEWAFDSADGVRALVCSLLGGF